MKVWHWFLNRPSLCFTVEPDVATLLQRLRLQATVSQCLIQLNMADPLTLHLNKQKQHIMISPAIMADWSDLVQGSVDLFSFMDIWMCATATVRITSICACVYVWVSPYPNKWRRLGQRAWSTACPLIAIYILAQSLISNSPIICHPTPSAIPPLCLMLMSMSGLVSVIPQWEAPLDYCFYSKVPLKSSRFQVLLPC